MSDLLSADDVARLAKATGKTVSEICRMADVAPSTFSRWKAGKTEPTLSVYRKLVAALDCAQPDAAKAVGANHDPASHTPNGREAA